MSENASAFDPDNFLNQEVTEANSTEIIPVPEFDDVPGMVKPGSITVRQIHNAEKGITSTILNLDWEVDDQGARETTGRDHPTVRQSVFLDLDNNGRIDTGDGKNVALGRLREAVGLNEGNFSIRMLEGLPARLRIRHRDAEIGGMSVTVAEVRGVLPIDAS